MTTTFAPEVATAQEPLRHPWRWLALICLVHLALATAFNLATPAATRDQHNPDENAHMLYIAQLASGHLPVFKDGSNAYESHQPPLYYALAVPVYELSKGAGPEAATRAVRGFTSLLGVLLLVGAFLAIRALYPSEPRVALATAGFIALIPMNCNLSGSVTNDVLVDLLIVVGLWRLTALCVGPPGSSSPDDRTKVADTRPLKRQVRANKATGILETHDAKHVKAQVDSSPANTRSLLRREAAVLGAVLGLAILTKTSGLLLAPAIVVAFGFLAWRKLADATSVGVAFLICFGVALVIAGPWLIRNTMLYGDPLAQTLFLKSFKATAHADVLISLLGGFNNYCVADAQWTFASFWGVFDSMRLFYGYDPTVPGPTPSKPLALPYGILFGLGMAGLVGFIGTLRRSDTRPSQPQQAMLWAMLVLVLATLYSFFMFNMTFFQAQGRYWYPSLLPLAFVFAMGFRGYYPQKGWLNAVYTVLALLMVGLNIYTIAVLLPQRYV